MTKKHNHESVDTNIESLSKVESFVTRHNKKIIAGVIAIVVAVAVFLWYRANEQKKVEAAKNDYAELEMNALKELEAIDNYTTIEEHANDAAKYQAILNDIETYQHKHGEYALEISSFLAGIVAYNAENYEKAIQHFSEYNGSDKIFNARAQACIGDCHIALENYEQALKNYEAAIEIKDEIYTPEYAFIAGLIAEKLNNKEKALAFYTLIEEQYPGSPRYNEINKYIGRVEAK